MYAHERINAGSIDCGLKVAADSHWGSWTFADVEFGGAGASSLPSPRFAFDALLFVESVNVLLAIELDMADRSRRSTAWRPSSG